MSQRPSAENAADLTDPALCAINRASDLRPAKSHKMTVLSVELVAMIWPSGENAIALINPWCSSGKGEEVPVAKSHKSGLQPSPPPVASDLPSGANARPNISHAPFPVQTSERSSMRHNSMVWAGPPAAASNLPSEEMAREAAGFESVMVAVT